MIQRRPHRVVLWTITVLYASEKLGSFSLAKYAMTIHVYVINEYHQYNPRKYNAIDISYSDVFMQQNALIVAQLHHM